MENEHVSVSHDHVKKSSEINLEESKPLVERKQDECSSSSSSSRSSLEFDAVEKGNLEASSPESKWEMKSPPPQTTAHPADYDPNRIPSSIFSSKPATNFEWSAASNESLFSIHMGNNSFSRDYAVLFGKSGELPPWVEELNDANSSEAKCRESSSLPPVMEASAHEENGAKFDHGSRHGQEHEHHDKSPQAASKMGSAEDVNFTAPAPSSSPPRLSDESGNSSSSFAFPVLVNESVKSSSLKATTEKVEQPQTQSQTQAPLPEAVATPKASEAETTPKASEAKWFSCISCCPRWCC